MPGDRVTEAGLTEMDGAPGLIFTGTMETRVGLEKVPPPEPGVMTESCSWPVVPRGIVPEAVNVVAETYFVTIGMEPSAATVLEVKFKPDMVMVKAPARIVFGLKEIIEAGGKRN